MSEKQKLQEKELQSVSGGFGVVDGKYITCKNCKNSFEKHYAYDKKTVGSGCNSKTIFQCPKCKNGLMAMATFMVID